MTKMQQIRHHLWELLRQQTGVALVYLSLILIPLIGLAGLAIDSAYLVYLKTRLQTTADAAALASARNLPFKQTQLTTNQVSSLGNIASYYGNLNMPANDFGNVIMSNDMEFGYWQQQTFVAHNEFTTGNEFINAVQVTASLTSAKGNAPDLHFAQLFNASANQLSHTSIALAQTDNSGNASNCLRLGLTALGVTELGSTNNFYDGTCVHGEGGIKLGSSNCAAASGPAGAAIFSVPFPGGPLGNGGTDYGSNNAVKPHDECGSGQPNNDLLSHTQSKSLLDYADNDVEFIFDLAFTAGHLAHTIAVQQAIDDLIATGIPQGLQVQTYTDDVTIDTDLENTVIISSGTIDVTSNHSLNNVYLLADKNVEVGSNVNLGRLDYCTNPNQDQLLIMAAEEIKIGSNTRTTAAQFIAGQYIDFGSNEPLYGNSLLSGGDIKLGSNVDIHPCDASNPVINYATNEGNQIVASRLVY